MPAIVLEWMEAASQQPPSWIWVTYAYQLLAPRISVRGYMALFVLVVVLSAFLWLLARAYTVINTPNDILVEKLGLDIPPTPQIILEEIAARHVQLSWKLEDATTSIHEFLVELNGKVVGATKKNETAAIIENLNPLSRHELRVFSVSHGRFQTPSPFLYLRTTKASSTSSQDSSNDGHPVVRPLAPRLPSAPLIAPAPASGRDLSTTHIANRRGTAARRVSPAETVENVADTNDPEDEPGEDLAELSERFADINNEKDAIEAQIIEETRDFEAQEKEKKALKAALQQELKEREEATNDLKRQVHRAEAHARTLANERAKKEKVLKEKQNKRRQRTDEMAKWEEQSQSIAEEIEAIQKQENAIRRRGESDVRAVKEQIAEGQLEIQQLEEEHQEKSQQLRELHEERKRNAPDEEIEESIEADRLDKERDLRFRNAIANLAQQYNDYWQAFSKQQQDYVLARQRLAMIDTARRATAVTFAPQASIDMETARRVDRSRRTRHASSHGSNVSSPRIAYAPEPFSSVNQAVTTSSPLTNRTTQPFNPVNGMTTGIDIPLSQDEEDDDPGFAPMSPRADALLPTDLLGDDSDDGMVPEDDEMPTKPTAADHSSSHFAAFRPASPQDDPGASPSPGSNSSPRSFTSPREEFFGEIDTDRKSTRSIHPPIPEDAPAEPPAHKRLTSINNLFSFNRQRGKTSSAGQPPLLGSLKHESHSFPRKMEDFDSAMQPRRRLSYGGNWAFPGGNFLGKQGDEEPDPAKPSIYRRAFPNLLPGMSRSATRNYDPFASRTNSSAPDGRGGGSSSPRPGSTYSFDVLPRPSMDDAFRSWQYDRPGARNSPLVPDWASAISRSHSRRPSVGYGSTTNLSLRPDDDGEFIEPRRDPRPLQAPIGTRPASSQRPATPKLNPNAPSFNMFNFGKNKDKDKDKTKPKEDGSLANSPPESRKSRDTHSIAPTTSTLESSRDSLERTVSTSGYSTIAGTNSLESTPATATKEKPTFISKITRKASSNKFDSWKQKSTGLFLSSRKGTPGGAEATTPTGEFTEDEHLSSSTHGAGSSEHLGRSIESTSSTPGATPTGEEKKGSRSSLGSWNFMRKKQKVPSALNGSSAVRNDDLISESGELVSESGNTTDLDHESSSAWDEQERERAREGVGSRQSQSER